MLPQCTSYLEFYLGNKNILFFCCFVERHILSPTHHVRIALSTNTAYMYSQYRVQVYSTRND